jgi:hypothetical protein
MSVYDHNGREIKPFTAADMLAEAQGVLSAWVSTYTEPEDGQPQRKMRCLDDSVAGQVDVSVEGARFSSDPDRRFRVVLTVEELPAELPRSREGTR